MYLSLLEVLEGFPSCVAVSLCVLVSALLCLFVMCVVFGSDLPLDSVQLSLSLFASCVFKPLPVCLPEGLSHVLPALDSF